MSDNTTVHRSKGPDNTAFFTRDFILLLLASLREEGITRGVDAHLRLERLQGLTLPDGPEGDAALEVAVGAVLGTTQAEVTLIRERFRALRDFPSLPPSPSPDAPPDLPEASAPEPSVTVTSPPARGTGLSGQSLSTRLGALRLPRLSALRLSRRRLLLGAGLLIALVVLLRDGLPTETSPTPAVPVTLSVKEGAVEQQALPAPAQPEVKALPSPPAETPASPRLPWREKLLLAGVLCLLSSVLIQALMAQLHRTEERWAQALANLPGPHHYELNLPPPFEPFPGSVLEHVAQLLSRLTDEEGRGQTLDVARTGARLLTFQPQPLVFKPRRVRRPVLILEDGGQEMAPFQARIHSLLQGLQARGVLLAHYYFVGSTQVVSRTRLGALQPLEPLLSGQRFAGVIVLSTGAGLAESLLPLDRESEPGESSDPWEGFRGLTRLSRRVWLHPIADPHLWREPLQAPPFRLGVFPLSREGLVAAARNLLGQSPRGRLEAPAPVTVEELEALMQLLTLAHRPTPALAAELRRTFLPEVPEAALLLALQRSRDLSGQALVWSKEQRERLLQGLRSQASRPGEASDRLARGGLPMREVQVRERLLALLSQGEPGTEAPGRLSSAQLQWRRDFAEQALALSGEREGYRAQARRTLLELAGSPFWPEIPELLKRHDREHPAPDEQLTRQVKRAVWWAKMLGPGQDEGGGLTGTPGGQGRAGQPVLTRPPLVPTLLLALLLFVPVSGGLWLSDGGEESPAPTPTAVGGLEETATPTHLPGASASSDALARAGATPTPSPTPKPPTVGGAEPTPRPMARRRSAVAPAATAQPEAPAPAGAAADSPAVVVEPTGATPAAVGGATPGLAAAGTTSITWVSIPGTGPLGFMMGSRLWEGQDNERPRHKVIVSPFQLSKTEVTVAQYRACVDAGKCTEPDTNGTCNWQHQPDRDNHPINCVDWNQAKAFASWAGARLPSESEWEYAARGKDGRKYPWGNSPEPSCDVAVTIDCSGTTQPVCSTTKGNTVTGLCDMGGNVWEWVEDCYEGNYTDAPSDGSARTKCSSSSLVVRGGSWGTDGDWLRAAYRNIGTPDVRNANVGFRVARGGSAGGELDH